MSNKLGCSIESFVLTSNGTLVLTNLLKKIDYLVFKTFNH